MNIERVKEAIRTEQQNNAKVWLELSQLIRLCKDRYGLAVTREFFIDNPAFRIYRTPNPLEIYIALAETIDTLYHSAINCPTPEKSILKSKPSKQSVAKLEPPEQVISIKPSKQVSSINSCEALSQALVDILRELGAREPHSFVEISVLTKHFYEVYRQPIKPLLNELIPSLRFVEFLQCYDSFILAKVDCKWTVALRDAYNL
jgi:hypothetical protein